MNFKFTFLFVFFISIFCFYGCRNSPKGAAKIGGVPTYHVFVENSASMYGYVEGQSDFKGAAYALLTDIVNPGIHLTNTMKLSYINSVTIPLKDDLTTFIKNLNVKTFKAKGGSHTTSDIAEVMKRVLDTTPRNDVAMLISDYLISPGKGKNAKSYLSEQENTIKMFVNDRLSKQKDFTILLLKLNSQFNGTYYNYNNDGTVINKPRPYYIWCMGAQANIDALIEKVDLQKLTGYETMHVFYPATAKENFAILHSGKVGNFTFDKQEKHTLNDAETATHSKVGSFGFAIGANLNRTGADTAYLKNISNYAISNQKYKISIETVTPKMKKDQPELANYSHKIQLETNDLQTEVLEISLKRTVPQWVTDTNTMDDSKQIGAELYKTFGFANLFGGVNAAYQNSSTAKNKSNFFTFSININK